MHIVVCPSFIIVHYTTYYTGIRAVVLWTLALLFIIMCTARTEGSPRCNDEANYKHYKGSSIRRVGGTVTVAP